MKIMRGVGEISSDESRGRAEDDEYMLRRVLGGLNAMDQPESSMTRRDSLGEEAETMHLTPLEARRYQRRPLEVEAVRYTGNNVREIIELLGEDRVRVESAMLPGPGRGLQEGIIIHGVRGATRVPVGHMVVKNPDGRFWSTSEKAFVSNFEMTG